jgi:hypothetical protein
MKPAEAALAIATLAACITSEREFIAVMQDVKPSMREAVYTEIKPHLGYAGVRPFELIPFDLDA